MISRTALRLRIPQFTTSQSNPYRNLTRFSSSWSSSATATATAPAPPLRNENDGGEESKVYQASRKFARPATVTWSQRLCNSVSVIGTVEYAPKQYDSKDGKVGAHSVLLVKPSSNSSRHFRLTLWMWDILAERALAHLKQNDYIYVYGQLGSFTKFTSEGTERMYYKVTANKLNYVQVPDENFLVGAKPGSETGESSDEKYRNRINLWQLLFANPDEWYDERKTKKTPRHPDFKHKSSGEALWLKSVDPPWVKKQVELLDSRLPGRPSDEVPFGSLTSGWLSDHQSATLDLINNISYDKQIM